jgi:ligand-binding SRPBCC domain-containing protein
VDFRHRFRVRAPLEVVSSFHLRTASLPEITPPPVAVRLTMDPGMLSQGDEMEMELRLGPLALRWTAAIEEVTPRGFTDRQLRGPFARWVHHHRFEPLDSGWTAVIDHVQAELRPHPIWGAVGLAMWLGMPLLFAYRSWATRRRLGRGRR